MVHETRALDNTTLLSHWGSTPDVLYVLDMWYCMWVVYHMMSAIKTNVQRHHVEYVVAYLLAKFLISLPQFNTSLVLSNMSKVVAVFICLRVVVTLWFMYCSLKSQPLLGSVLTVHSFWSKYHAMNTIMDVADQ